MLRARLSLFALEGRENPSSGPSLIDPIGLPGTPPSDPTPPAQTAPAPTPSIGDIIGGAGGSVATGTTPAPYDPFTAINPITGQPMIQ